MKRVNWSEKKLLVDEKWSRIYETDDGIPIRVSKFVTDRIEVSLEAVKKDWSSWLDSERFAFVRAFARKRAFSPEDEGILSFLIDLRDERILESIAISVSRLSNQERAYEFLIAWLRSSRGPKANYAHALGLLGDRRAIPALRNLHDELASNISRKDVDQFTILDFVSCCSALKKLGGSTLYDDEIKQFLEDPRQDVRGLAEAFLKGGPPSC